MDAFILLPKGIQKKTMDFIDKFKQNPKSMAIHLEKINDFRDENLRSARIDQTYRAIIHVSKTDEVFHLLWAAHHDDCYDWARNKVFEWNGNTQSYQIFDVTNEVISKPIEAANGPFHIYTDIQLEQIGVPGILLPSVRAVTDTKNLMLIEKYLPQEVYERLYFLIEGISIDEIIADVEEGKASAADMQADTVNNKRFFFEITDKNLETIFTTDFQKWKIFLHPSQLKIVNAINKGSVKVTGLAGTGKTVCALHRAKFITENFSVSTSNPLLFTTFTKSLVTTLKDSLKELGVDESLVEVKHIHGLAIDLAKKHKLITEKAKILDFSDYEYKIKMWEDLLDSSLSYFDADFFSSEYTDVVVQNNITTEDEYLKISRVGRSQKLGRKDRLEIWKVFEAYNQKKKTENYFELGEVLNLLNNYFSNKSNKPYSFIIADEIQDFSNVELRLIRSMTHEHDNDVFLVGDPYQKIYARKINFSKSGINVRGNRSKQLKINYRTTDEIRQLAITTVQGIEYDNFDGEKESSKGYISLTHGEKPSYSVFEKESEEFEFIRSKVEELISNGHGISFSNICIACRTKNALAEVKKYIHNAKIPYYDVTTSSGNSTGVHLSTFHNVKGLEYKIMFLSGINSKSMPLRPGNYDQWDRAQQAEFDIMEKSLLYVAMTRAIQHLYLSGSGKKSEWIRLV